MTFIRVLTLVSLALAALRSAAAINPEEYKRVASDVVRLREIARVVEREAGGKSGRQRVTIVGEVVERLRGSSGHDEPRTIVIDYTVDLAARDAAAKEHAAKQGRMPGPQFMHEPEPPQLDASREFWAHLAPVAGRLGNVNRYAGRVVNMHPDQFAGPVFVPVAGQYSWDAPTGWTGKAASTSALPETFTGIVRTGIMAIGGESTGMVIEINGPTSAHTYELDVRGDRDAAAKLESLDGKMATITGDLQTRPGVEIKERKIIRVRSIVAGK